MCIWCVLHGKTLGNLKELPSCESTFCLPDSFLDDGGVTLENLIDWDTVSNLPEALQVCVPERIIPLKTTGDGNCLLHAVSRAIWGVELYFELLRVKVHEELVNNIDWYKKSAKEFNDEDWERVLRSAGKTGQHLEFIHTLALSNVIKRPILLYASDGDMERYGQGESGVAATFVPSRIGASECSQRPIILAWQTSHKNHYVPIVGITGRNSVEWLPLKPAFPDGIPEGEDALSYLHFDAEIIEPQVVKLIEEQKKEIVRRREEERKLLEGIQESLQKAMKAHQPGRKRFFEEEDEEEEEEEEEEESDLMQGITDEDEDMGAYIAPPGSLIRTPEGFIRVPKDRTWVLTYGKGGDKKHEEMVSKLKQKMLAKEMDQEAKLRKLLSMVEEKTKKKQKAEKSKKLQHNGQEWDYVFRIRLEKRGPDRYIACNKDDNLAEVAERFLLQEGLPLQYIPRIASFLSQNISADSNDTAMKDAEKQPNRPPAPQGTRIPVNATSSILYKAGRFDGILKKISEFNALLAANESTKKLAMDAEEGILLKRTLDTLQAVTAYNTSSFVLDEYKVMKKLLSWPSDKLFPVLDILRLMVLHPKAAEHFRLEHAKGNNFLVQLLRMIQPSKAASNNCLCVLKFLCNMFCNEDLKTIAEENCDLILKVCVPCTESEVLPIRLCLANLLVNFAAQIASKKKDITEMKFLLLTLLRQMLVFEQDAEALFSILAALGTLLHDDWNTTEVAYKNLGFTPLVETHVKSADTRVAECAKDILSIIQWAKDN